MTRPLRICLKSLLGLAVLAALVVVAGIWTVRTAWFHNLVRSRIIAEAERATGGRVELGAFHFNWHDLTAELDNLTVHGTEAAGQAPLLAVDRVTIGLRIISMLERTFDVKSLRTERPRLHLIVNPDGSTNVPKPRVPSTKSTIATVLDLKISRFDVADGLIVTESPGLATTKPPFAWNARGEKLTARVDWNRTNSTYDGRISIDPFHFVSTRSSPLDARIELAGALARNQLTLREAHLTTAASQINLTSVVIGNFTDPVATAGYSASISAHEAGRILQLSAPPAGQLNANGTLRYHAADDFALDGQLNGASLSISLKSGRIDGVALDTAFAIKPGNADFTAARVRWRSGALQGTAHFGPKGVFTAAGKASQFDAAAIVALLPAGRLPSKLPYDAVLSGSFDANGRLDQPVVSAHLSAAPAPGQIPVHGDLDLHYDALSQELRLAPSWLTLPHTRVDASGVFGVRLNVKAQSSDLADLRPLLDEQSVPLTLQSGTISFDGTVSGPIFNPSVAGHGAINNATFHGQNVSSAAGDFTLTRDSIRFTDLQVSAAQLAARLSGTLGLISWLPSEQSAVNANVRLNNAGLPQLMALLGAGSLPVSGTLATTAQLTGTLNDPHATATFNLARGQIYGENYDQISGSAQYRGNGTESLDATFTQGSTRLTLSSQIEHKPGALLPARVSFNLAPASFSLTQLQPVHRRVPGLSGMMQARASGAFDLTRNASGRFEADPVRLDAELNAQRIVLDGRSLGDINLSATTAAGVINARFESSLPGAALRGQATLNLTAAYPIRGNVTFTNANPAILIAMARPPGDLTPIPLSGSATGDLTFSGSALSPDKLDASLAFSALALRPGPDVTGPAQKFELHNEGPVRLALAGSRVRIDEARFTGPNSDFTLTGTLPLSVRQPLNVGVHGGIDLTLAQLFTPGLTSTGKIAINAQVAGTWLDPDFSGRADLTKGEFRYQDYSNGLTNANGTVLFTGTRAIVQSLTAETGGGKVEASGFAAVTGGQFAFRLDVKTSNVRVRYPPGISSVSDSQITIAGTSLRSDASGAINIRRITVNPGADAATMLLRTAQPLQLGNAGVGPLANMNLDIQVSTTAETVFETSVAEGVQADANLRLRGTLSNPALLGRINITQGDVNFFGNRYTINQGSVSFLNPARIDPILNVDLETKARGVDVILTVAGPIDKLNVTYRSDPPLQFSDIVALLATGRTPNDPTLAIRDTGQQQSFQGVGASELLGQAIANPVAGRLQRFFGVSNIKIDPQLTGVTGSPEARLTIEQQVTPDILFTYISDISNTSTQLIRIEWALNHRWSGIVTRDENGYVAVDFVFKKHLK